MIAVRYTRKGGEWRKGRSRQAPQTYWLPNAECAPRSVSFCFERSNGRTDRTTRRAAYGRPIGGVTAAGFSARHVRAGDGRSGTDRENAMMRRLTTPAALALALVMGGGGNDASAQDNGPIPAIIAEAWPTPIGGYAPLRVRMANGNERVRGGALVVSYRIECEGGTCYPKRTLRTGQTLIPCGGSEGGILDHDVSGLMGVPGTETVTLEITGIRFDGYTQDEIDGINDRYGEILCPAGGYSPATLDSGAQWTSKPVTVR